MGEKAEGLQTPPEQKQRLDARPHSSPPTTGKRCQASSIQVSTKNYNPNSGRTAKKCPSFRTQDERSELRRQILLDAGLNHRRYTKMASSAWLAADKEVDRLTSCPVVHLDIVVGGFTTQ